MNVELGLSLRTLLWAQAVVGLTLLVCLVIYCRYQKTYPGFLHWVASYACSLSLLLLFAGRGVIPDVFSKAVANSMGLAAIALIYQGFCQFNNENEGYRKNALVVAVLSAAILYFTVVQDDVLIRTVVMTGTSVGYSYAMARVCWRYRSGRQHNVCRIFTLLFLSFSAFGVLRLVFWLFDPELRNLFQPSLVNAGYTLFFIALMIGMAFCLIFMNGMRLAAELQQEQESSLARHQALLDSQQQLRQAIRYAPFPLMVHAEDGSVLQISETWTEITGYELADIPTTGDWVAKAYGVRQAEVMRGVEALYDLETRTDEGEFALTTRAGEQRIWQFSTAPLGRFDSKRLVISMAVDVTERKQVEEQLRQLNQKLESIVAARTAELEDLYNNAPCAYHSLDANGVYVRINDTELGWLGLSRQEVVGKRKLIEFVPPEQAEMIKKALQTIKSQGSVQAVDYELCGADGKRRKVIGGATAIVDENGTFLRTRSTLFDVTERFALDQELSQVKLMLTTFLDEASDPAHITDAEGKFLYVNQAWSDLLGYSREEAKNLTLYDVTNKNEHIRWDVLLHVEPEKGGSQRSDYLFVNKAGQTILIETVSLSRYEQGVMVGTQAILTDVTARRKIEAALREGQHQLSIANQELERMSSMKDDFLASMSHELRTPLTAVIGLSEILRDGAYGELPPEQVEVVASIEQSGRHLLALINDILDLSKLEAKQVALEMDVCSAADIGQASIQFIKSMAAKKNILVDFVVEPQSIGLHGDPRRLKQMLINLLSNAVKFTPEGGKVGLLIRADKDIHKLMFTVWDTGIGIRGEDMGKLFQPFVQIDSSLGRQYAGTGLGLVLVQKAARMHGGQVLVESAPGVGSRFTIELPWQSVQEDERCEGDLCENATALAQMMTSDAEYPLVLLAEDNPVNLKVLMASLRNKPWRLIVAEDGVKAVEQASIHRPDIILMDVQMPHMDGLSAIRLIRADTDLRLARTPIIALTALAMKGDRDRCLRAGADEYVTKPIDFKELISKMQALVSAAKVR